MQLVRPQEKMPTHLIGSALLCSSRGMSDSE